MQLQEVIDFIENKGWTYIESTPKFLHYKPPTEIGFRPTYSLPIPRQEDLEGFDIALHRAANTISQVYEKPISELFNINGVPPLSKGEFYWHQEGIQKTDGTYIKFAEPILCKVFLNKKNERFIATSEVPSIQIESVYFNDIKNTFNLALLERYRHYLYLTSHERTYSDGEKTMINFFDKNVKKEVVTSE